MSVIRAALGVLEGAFWLSVLLGVVILGYVLVAGTISRGASAGDITALAAILAAVLIRRAWRRPDH